MRALLLALLVGCDPQPPPSSVTVRDLPATLAVSQDLPPRGCCLQVWASALGLFEAQNRAAVPLDCHLPVGSPALISIEAGVIQEVLPLKTNVREP